MKSAGMAALLLLGLLSGCAGSEEDATGTQDPGVDVQATDTTGVIRGVVVDSTITPLVGAIVTIRVDGADRTNETNDVGGFGFGGLKEGTYFVIARKPGFTPSQTSVEVVAGDNEPPVVRLTLEIDQGFVRPFATAQKQAGYIECTTNFVAVCGAPNIVSQALCTGELDPIPPVCAGNVTSDKFGFYIFYPGGETMVQSEMFWQSTQSLSTQLTLSMENIAGCEAENNAYIESVTGDSPIYQIADAADLEAGTIGGTCGIWHSIFSGDTAGLPAGITLQQKFEIISHAFYGFLPPEGYRFSVDGDPKPPI